MRPSSGGSRRISKRWVPACAAVAISTARPASGTGAAACADAGAAGCSVIAAPAFPAAAWFAEGRRPRFCIAVSAALMAAPASSPGCSREVSGVGLGAVAISAFGLSDGPASAFACDGMADSEAFWERGIASRSISGCSLGLASRGGCKVGRSSPPFHHRAAGSGSRGQRYPVPNCRVGRRVPLQSWLALRRRSSSRSAAALASPHVGDSRPCPPPGMQQPASRGLRPTGRAPELRPWRARGRLLSPRAVVVRLVRSLWAQAEPELELGAQLGLERQCRVGCRPGLAFLP